MYENITLIFDLDGTICPIKSKDARYEDLIPNSKVVDKIKEYKNGGAKIIINTSRNMKTYNGNIGLINANTAKVLLNWLDKWQIPFDEIIYGKPWPGEKGFYIDDRSIRPDEFIENSYEYLEKICKKSSVK